MLKKCTNFLLFFVLLASLISNVSSASPFRSNPYEILALPPTATQKEIQQQYRSLCLKYHPDKNRKEDDDTKDDDFAFKEVQHAYSLIGTVEDRRKYDMMSRFTPPDIPGFRPNHMDGFANQDNFGSSMYFTFGGNGPSFRFYPYQRFSTRYSRPFQFNPAYSRSKQDMTAPSKRAHYVQKVVVPLEKLYEGGAVDFTISASILEGYKAAYRGGVLVPLVTQTAATIIMTWLRSQKVNWLLSLFLFATIVHVNLPPPPVRKMYKTSIKRGWKAGTKVTYKVDEPGGVSDVSFVIQEGSHDVYKRLGDDLHATISVKKRRLRRGCTVYIDPLSSQEEPIKLRLKRGEVKEDGHVVVVKGRGWPKSSSRTEAFGDLIVKICIKA